MFFPDPSAPPMVFTPYEEHREPAPPWPVPRRRSSWILGLSVLVTVVLLAILFTNGMRFHGMDILSPSGRIALTGPLTAQHDFSTIRIRLWWSVDQAPTADYSVGTYLFFRGAVVDQVDGARREYTGG